MGLNDIGWDETGSYDLGVNCLLGACPTVAPAVPVPYVVWLFVSGLVGMIEIARRKT